VDIAALGGAAVPERRVTRRRVNVEWRGWMRHRSGGLAGGLEVGRAPIDFRSGVHYRPETEMATSFWYRSPA